MTRSILPLDKPEMPDHLFMYVNRFRASMRMCGKEFAQGSGGKDYRSRGQIPLVPLYFSLEDAKVGSCAVSYISSN